MPDWRNPEVTREDAEKLVQWIRKHWPKQLPDYHGIVDVYWHALWSLSRTQLKHGAEMLRILNPVHAPGPIQMWRLCCGLEVDFDSRKGNRAVGTSMKEKAGSGSRYTNLPELKADFS